jgi:hypothetical protein
MDTDEPTSPLTPVAAYHLADPQTRQSQGLLLVSLETRSLDRSHALERERPLGEDQAQEAESL